MKRKMACCLSFKPSCDQEFRHLVHEASHQQSDLHEHEVGGGAEVGEADEGEVVVEAVECGRHKVEKENALVCEDSFPERDCRLVSYVDQSAKKELQCPNDENDRYRIERIVTLAVPTSCHNHALDDI